MKVEKWIHKARSSWWEDGIMEMVSGAGLLLVAVTGLLKEHTSGTARSVWNFTWIATLLILAFGGKFVVRWIKSKWIWPRSGYAYPETSYTRRWIALVFLLFALAIFLLILFVPENPISITVMKILAFSFIFSVFFGIYTYSKASRFLLYAFSALVGGDLLLLAPLSLNDFIMSLLALVSISTLIGGIFQLWRYLTFLNRWKSHE